MHDLEPASEGFLCAIDSHALYAVTRLGRDFSAFYFGYEDAAFFDEHDIDYARVFARSSNVFYNNYNLYVRKEQESVSKLLIAKAKGEVDYNNPKWYRNIVFDEFSLEKLAELFPQRQIKTDYDAVKLIEELGDNALKDLEMKLKERK